jgi:hypothetical protein
MCWPHIPAKRASIATGVSDGDDPGSVGPPVSKTRRKERARNGCTRTRPTSERAQRVKLGRSGGNSVLGRIG